MTAGTATGLRVAALTAWLAVLLAIGFSGWSSDGAVIAAVGASLLAGLLVGRWWALAAAPALGLGLVGYGLAATGPDPEMGVVGVLYVLALYVLLVDGPLGVGVGLRRLIDLGRRPKAPAPMHPATEGQ